MYGVFVYGVCMVYMYGVCLCMIYIYGMCLCLVCVYGLFCGLWCVCVGESVCMLIHVHVYGRCTSLYFRRPEANLRFSFLAVSTSFVMSLLKEPELHTCLSLQDE